ncbi:MAG: SsrA-binding protein SmpB [bacterium]
MKKNEKTSEHPNRKVVATNRKARHNYHILDVHQVGLVLVGTEVKSLRAGHASLVDAYADILNGEMYLINCHINAYTHGTAWNHNPLRPRKLLLHRREIDKLAGKVQQRGFTLIPLSIYFEKGLAKIDLALARGKKQYDKREDLKRRDQDREIERALSKRY